MAREHGERRGVHPLRVLQVTGRVVRHVQRSAPPGRGPALGQELGHVAHLGRERARRVRAEQVTVALEQRAAAGAVHHDVVGRSAEGRARSAAPAPRRRRGRRRARAAPRSRPGPAPDDPIAVGLERAPGGLVDVAEQGVHDAAAEQGDGGRGAVTSA